MALALYRKYRPATFADVVGQEHVTEPLRTALAAGRINHAYLFSGPRGCGKTSSARILARSLNCEQGPTPDPCGVCGSCVALAPEGPGSLDVVELDAASHGGVDDTRELRDRAFYMPAESRFRVFIIDEAHMVTSQGFNALLKIVEEPPEHLVFMFATTEPDKVLPTIRSRTHHYPFRLIPPTTLRELLDRLCAQEGAKVEPAVFPLVIRAGGGSARDSLSVLDQLLAGAGPEGVTYREAVALLGVTDAALLDEVVDALAAGDGASVFGAVDRVVEAGHDPRRFAADLLQRMRDLVVIDAVPDAAAKGLIDAPEDQLAAMTAQSERLGAATLTRLAEVLHTGLVDMRGTTSPRLVLELMCARMLLPAASTADGALLQRLERMERRLAIAGDAGAAAPAVPTSASESEIVRPGPVTPESPGQAPEPKPPARRGQALDGGAGPAGATAPNGPTVPAAPAVPAADGASPGLGLPQRPRLTSERGKSGARSSASAEGSRDNDAVAPADRSGGERRARDDAAAAQRRGGGSAPAARTGDRETADATTSSATPVEAATSAAAAAGPGTIDVTDVRRVWPEVLLAVQRHRRTTQILLESATVVGVDGATLKLSMPSTGMARRVLEQANADLLRAALAEVLGVKWTIACEAAGGEPSDRPRGGATPAGRPAANAAGAGGTVPPPDEPPDDDIPDDYGSPPPTGPAAVKDPEEAAIELLATQLGAKRVDPATP